VSFILSYFERWKLSSLPHHYGADRVKLFTARILAGVLLGLTVIMVTFLVVTASAGSALMDDRTKAFFIPMQFGVVAILLFSFWLLVKGRYHAGLMTFTYTAVIATLGSIVVTGGFPHSVASPCVIILPVIAFCLHGRKIGSWLVVMLPVVLAVQWYVVDKYQIELPDVTSKASPELNEAIVISLTYAIIMFVVACYDFNSRNLRAKLAAEREKFAQLANHDGLTGLVNSRHFNGIIDSGLNHASEKSEIGRAHV